MFFIRLFYMIFVMVLLSFALKAQVCFDQSITFSNQTSIDSFSNQYTACNTIDADVTINGLSITDLSGLSKIERITGNLIIMGNANLPSLSGLEAIDSIGGNLK